jgi:hypothetical protein
MENGRKMERGKSGRAKVRNITLRPCEVSRCGGLRPARSEDGAVKPINACQFAGGADLGTVGLSFLRPPEVADVRQHPLPQRPQQMMSRWPGGLKAGAVFAFPAV